MMNDKKRLNKSIRPHNRDAAWATFHTPLNATELKLFCQDIERLFRINPMLNFRKWLVLDSNRYFFAGQNISQQPAFDFEVILEVTQLHDGIQIEYKPGIKTRTTFIIQSLPGSQHQNQSKLTITDFYDGLSESERVHQLHRVDKSITVWAKDLQRYLISWQKWSHCGLWRWYKCHVWQPMKPMGRRITYLLFWITFFELALVLLGTAVYYLEYTD